jgi:hypothetical protein
MSTAMTEVAGPPVGNAVFRKDAAGTEHHHRYRERIEYRIYTVILFPFAVLAVLARRAGGRHHDPRFHHHPHFLSEVIELNRTTVPWVFMGR